CSHEILSRTTSDVWSRPKRQPDIGAGIFEACPAKLLRKHAHDGEWTPVQRNGTAHCASGVAEFAFGQCASDDGNRGGALTVFVGTERPAVLERNAERGEEVHGGKVHHDGLVSGWRAER